MAIEPLATRLARGPVGGLTSGLIFAGVTMWFASTRPPGKADMPLHGTVALVGTVYGAVLYVVSFLAIGSPGRATTH
ncbi:hypothetical protein [Nonomuraea sp. 10N515B]|uniref:hypothetical protein n=1 Tax=Nonomuraea sp. 10N515B TaxID=3457422 RepID=UPI003FCD71DC